MGSKWELATKLGALTGKPDYQLFLCNSGAEANENALKLASFHTGRKKIIAFTKSFHGRTSLAVAATDNKNYIAPVNETENVIFLPFNDATALEECFQKQGNEIAAVIIEGIQGVGGIHVADDSFLQGFPVAGILIAPEIPAKHFQLGTTFGGNHLACAAALAVLEVMEQENLMNNALQIGNWLAEQLKQIPDLKNVRGRGLMIGFDVPAALPELKKNLLLRQHIFTGEAKPNVIRLLPSLALTQTDASKFIASLQQEIQSPSS